MKAFNCILVFFFIATSLLASPPPPPPPGEMPPPPPPATNPNQPSVKGIKGVVGNLGRMGSNVFSPNSRSLNLNSGDWCIDNLRLILHLFFLALTIPQMM